MIKLAQVDTINLNELIESIDSIGDLDITLDIESLAEKIKIDASGNLVCSEIDKLVGKVFACTMLQGVYVHPSQNGHNALAKNLINAMKHPEVDKSAIKYHAADKSIRYALLQKYLRR